MRADQVDQEVSSIRHSGYRIGPLFEKPAAFHYRPFSTPR